MSYRIIGDLDTVLGYRFAGVEGDSVSSPDEAREAFLKATAPGSRGILLVTEEIEGMIEELVTAHRVSAKEPYLAVVPGIWGAKRGRKTLQQLINDAVGIKIVDSSRQD